MPSFSYTAVTKAGKTSRGAITATDEVRALELLARRGLTPTDLKPGRNAAIPWWQRDLFPNRQRPAQLLPVFATLATLLRARMTLIDALGFVEAQTSQPTLRNAITELRSELENGQTLAQALKGQDASILPNRVKTLLALGERSDTLPETCARISEMLQEQATVSGELRAALVYPVILLVMSFLVLGMLIFFLIPTLLPVFATAQADPPMLLHVLDTVRLAVMENGLVLLAGAVLVLIAVFLLRARIGEMAQWLLLRAPLTSPYLRKRNSLAFCQTMAVMLRAGMSSLDALEASRAVVRSGSWRAQIDTARRNIEAGASVSQALDQVGFLDSMAQSLIQAGDQTDQLGEMFMTAADALQSETRNTLKRAVTLVTPVLTLLIGALVGALIVSTITAILDLNDIAF